MRQVKESRVIFRIGMSFAILSCGAALNLPAKNASGADKQLLEPVGDSSVLLLVRAWDPKSGELVGWMPLHRAAITLQQVSPQPINLDLNDAVSVKLPGTSEKSDGGTDCSVAMNQTFDKSPWGLAQLNRGWRPPAARASAR